MGHPIKMVEAFFIRVEGKSHYREPYAGGKLGPLEVLRHQPSCRGPFRFLIEAKCAVRDCQRAFERNGCWVTRIQLRRQLVTEAHLQERESFRRPQKYRSITT